MFEAKFEHHDNKETLISIANKPEISKKVNRILNEKESPESKELYQAMGKKNKLKITGTPIVIINNNIRVTPQDTGDNINLMIKNLEEILLDTQFLQYGIC